MCEQCRAGGLMSYCLDDKTMTPEQKFRELWETVEGNCWHEALEDTPQKCKLCGNELDMYLTHIEDENPTLTLDVLFEIAKVMGYENIDFYSGRGSCTIYPSKGKLGDYKIIGSCQAWGDTPQLALLDALYQAMKKQ